MNNEKDLINDRVKSLEILINTAVESPKRFYEAIASSMTPEERLYIISQLQNKSCETCTNGSCDIENCEKIGLDEYGKPQGHDCMGWINDEYIGRSKVLEKTDIYQLKKM